MSIRLIQSYVQDRYFVSTAYRRSSASLNPDGWYYETLVWEWNPETKERGELLESHDSGLSRRRAMIEHAGHCQVLAERLAEPTPSLE